MPDLGTGLPPLILAPPAGPTITVAPPAPPGLLVVPGSSGPTGPAGSQGANGSNGVNGQNGVNGSNGQPRFTGQGAPPDFIYGAVVGDEYLDVNSGLIYTLG